MIVDSKTLFSRTFKGFQGPYKLCTQMPTKLVGCVLPLYTSQGSRNTGGNAAEPTTCIYSASHPSPAPGVLMMRSALATG